MWLWWRQQYVLILLNCRVRLAAVFLFVVVQRKAVNCQGTIIILLVIPFITIVGVLVPFRSKSCNLILLIFLLLRNQTYAPQHNILETHQANLYLISSSPWSLLLPGPLQFRSLSLPSSSFQPAPPWPGSLFSSNWILPSPSFLAAAPSDPSLSPTPPTTYRLTGYPAGFSGEVPFF